MCITERHCGDQFVCFFCQNLSVAPVSPNTIGSTPSWSSSPGLLGHPHSTRGTGLLVSSTWLGSLPAQGFCPALVFCLEGSSPCPSLMPQGSPVAPVCYPLSSNTPTIHLSLQTNHSSPGHHLLTYTYLFICPSPPSLQHEVKTVLFIKALLCLE